MDPPRHCWHASSNVSAMEVRKVCATWKTLETPWKAIAVRQVCHFEPQKEYFCYKQVVRRSKVLDPAPGSQTELFVELTSWHGRWSQIRHGVYKVSSSTLWNTVEQCQSSFDAMHGTQSSPKERYCPPDNKKFHCGSKAKHNTFLPESKIGLIPPCN